MTTDHRSEAERWLGEAHRVYNSGRKSDSQAPAIIAAAHALLAGPANICQGCGIERPREHDAWCEFGKQPAVTPKFPVDISDIRDEGPWPGP